MNDNELIEKALDLLEEWHDWYSESNRRLEPDTIFTDTQKFLIENSP